MKIKYDVDTNLPELPNDLFWRVEDGEHYEWYGKGDPSVRIMRRHTRKFLWWSWDDPKDTGHSAYIKGGITKTSIQKAAEEAYEARERWREYQKSLSLLGDYPPKRLKD